MITLGIAGDFAGIARMSLRPFISRHVIIADDDAGPQNRNF